ADEPRDILGLDLVVSQWRRTLLTAVFGTAGYVWLLLILPLVALVSNRRLTQQRDALRNLTEAEDQGHAVVVIVDLALRIEYANTGFCRQLGYSRRELIGRPWRELQASDAQPETDADIMATVRS